MAHDITEMLSPQSLARLKTYETIVSQDSTLDDTLKRASEKLSNAVSEESRYDAMLAILSLLERSTTENSSEKIEGNVLKQLTEAFCRCISLGPDCKETTTRPLIAEAGLASVSFVSQISRKPPFSPTTLLTIVHYTNPSDPWSTSHAASTAESLLSRNLTESTLPTFILDTVLKDHLRPIFSKASSRITEAGRVAHFADPADDGRQPLERPRWKAAGMFVVTGFEWAVNAASEDVIAKNWPLFTPVLLTLAEDMDTPVRARGLAILKTFINKCPSPILQSTGIAKVFEEAILPTLLYLPSTTPEADSVKLLDPAYDALLAIAALDGDAKEPRRRKRLDKVLREGVFMGFTHASNYSRIMELLMQKTCKVVDLMGIYCVKHLDALVKLISGILTDPFALSDTPMVLAAATALNAVISNGWPRASEESHAINIMRGISVCWLNLHDGHSASGADPQVVDALKKQLQLTAAFLESTYLSESQAKSADWTGLLSNGSQISKLFTSLQAQAQRASSTG